MSDVKAQAEFTEFVLREMPSGTVISDPAWWAPRLWRTAVHAMTRGAAPVKESLTTDERARFEVEMIGKLYPWLGEIEGAMAFRRGDKSPDEYFFADDRAAWLAWQARAKIAEELSKNSGELRADHLGDANKMVAASHVAESKDAPIKQSSIPDAERARFEAWYREEHGPATVWMSRLYFDAIATPLWRGWQARAKIAGELSNNPGELRADHLGDANKMVAASHVAESKDAPIKQSSIPDAERARFEAWAISETMDVSHGPKTYNFPSTRFAWAAWQAAISQSAPAAQGEAVYFWAPSQWRGDDKPWHEVSAAQFAELKSSSAAPVFEFRTLYTTPQPSAQGVVTDAMVEAYLEAQATYWKKADELQRPIGKWRAGTPREATREGLKAALAPAPAN